MSVDRPLVDGKCSRITAEDQSYSSALQLASSGLAVDERFAGGAVVLMSWHCLPECQNAKYRLLMCNGCKTAQLINSSTFFVH